MDEPLSQRDSVTIEIFVANHCPTSQFAQEIANQITQHFPSICLRVTNVTDADAVVPEIVFATPTYLLNGRVWSLGNPSWQQVQQALKFVGKFSP